MRAFVERWRRERATGVGSVRLETGVTVSRVVLTEHLRRAIYVHRERCPPTPAAWERTASVFRAKND